MGVPNTGSTWEPRDEIAVCSGTIDGSNNVTLTHGSANIDHVVADHAGGTLIVHYKEPFDPKDGIYFAVGFVYTAGNVQAFLPTAFTSTTVTLTGGAYPGTAPWTFALFAITTP